MSFPTIVRPGAIVALGFEYARHRDKQPLEVSFSRLSHGRESCLICDAHHLQMGFGWCRDMRLMPVIAKESDDFSFTCRPLPRKPIDFFAVIQEDAGERASLGWRIGPDGCSLRWRINAVPEFITMFLSMMHF